MASAPPIEPLKDRAERLPTSPGCYLMKDADGVVIYVGKATNLRARVRSYFGVGDGRHHVRFLMQKVRDIEFALARDEREALLLENTLIKKHRPRYNIRLRDDKTYLSVRFDLKEDWPRLGLVRRPRSDGARYFGPYSSAVAVRQTLELIGQHFPLRTCTDREMANRTRPCIQHQIKRCVAPCVGYVSREDYADLCDQVVMVLDGKDRELAETLQGRMNTAAADLDFERAAFLRDRLKALEAVSARQQVVSHGGEDRDILGFHREGDEVVIVVVPVRRGRMQENQTFHFKDQAGEDPEILSSFLTQLYGDDRFIPTEILIPLDLAERETLEEILTERHPTGRKVRLHLPQRGDKTKLVELAEQTAEMFLKKELDEDRRFEKAAVELQKILDLPQPPQTLECFDISNFHGKQPVASKVRFRDGKPEKAGYRHFKIKTLEEVPNDYGMMREVLERRFRRSITEGGAPDVLVVDGGKGQLNVAVAVLKELGLETQPVMGFAKPDDDGARGGRPILIDKIFLPGRKNPVVLPNHSTCLKMLQHLRDESHRFAITFHRSLRDKKTLRSAVDDIPGVGETRRTRLLKHFGSVKRLREASVEEIAEVESIGPALAQEIWTHLHRA